ncbi:MAG: hypothetical protein ACO3C1_12100, partial [Ilumatobacteraceae bacterium]
MTRGLVRSAMAGLLVLAACSTSTESSSQTVSISTTAPIATTAPSGAPSTTSPTGDGVVALDSAAAVAAELSAVEAGVRDVTLSAEQLDALGRRQQLVYRAINRHPEWDAEVLASVDA